MVKILIQSELVGHAGRVKMVEETPIDKSG